MESLEGGFGPWLLTLVLGAVLGAVLGVAVQRGYERWSHPLSDYELWIDFEASPLFAKGATERVPTLRYKLSDFDEFRRPHLVRLVVWHAGSKDVRADAFATDLRMQMGVDVAASSVRVVEQSGDADVTFETPAGDVGIRIRPSLIRPSFFVIYEFIADGLPFTLPNNPVADLTIGSFYSEVGKGNRIFRGLQRVGVGMILAALVGVVTLIIVNAFGVDAPAPLAWLSGGLLAGGLVCLPLSVTVTPRRAALARRRLREHAKDQRLLALPQVRDLPEAGFR